MRRLIAVLNDLPSTGNSSIALALRHLLHEQDIDVKLLTTDENTPDDDAVTDFLDVQDSTDISTLIEALDASLVTIVDIASGNARRWADFSTQNELESLLSEMDAQMTVLIPTYGSDRCHEEVVDLAEIFSDEADYVIARVLAAPPSGNEEAWDESYAARVTDYLGAVSVEIPAIGKRLQTALDSHDLSLAEALSHPERLPRFAEIEVTRWREEAAQALDTAGEFLTADGTPTSLSVY